MTSVVHRPSSAAARAGSLLPRLTRRSSTGGLVLLGTLLQLVREPGVPVWRAVFGEDGGIFLTEALASPGGGSLLTPYQGYVQLAPRLLAEGVAVLPLSGAAPALAVSSALAVSLLSLFVYVASGALLHGRWARLAVAVAPVLLPAGSEINASITNLHWYLDYACFWALAGGSRRRPMVAAAAVVAVLSVLSDPLAGLFLPLAAWRLWRAFRATGVAALRAEERGVGLAELVVPAAFAVAGVLQLALGAAQQQPQRFLPSHWSDLPGIYGLRVAGSFLLGDRPLPWLFTHFGQPFAFLCLAVAVVGLTAAVRPRRSRPLVLLAASYSVLWVVVPLMLRGTETFLDRAHPGLPGSRYLFNPILLLTVSCAAWLDALPAHRASRAAEAGGRLVASSRTARAKVGSGRVLATGAFAVVVAVSWSIPSQRSNGPLWSSSLADAERRCSQAGGSPLETGRSAEAPWGLLARPGQVLAAVAPGGSRPAWSVLVDCAQLRARRTHA